MALKITKLTKYICSDGKEFIGGKNRKYALEHEKRLTDIHTFYNREKAIAKILEREDLFEEISLEMFRDGDDMNEIAEYINETLDPAICPGDIDDLTEMSEMIYEIIQNFGGLKIVENLYNFVKKRHEKEKSKK
jgi:hypothetical protein